MTTTTMMVVKEEERFSMKNKRQRNVRSFVIQRRNEREKEHEKMNS